MRPAYVLFLVCILFLLAIGSTAQTQDCSYDEAPATAPSDELDAALLCLVNYEREINGVAPLRQSVILDGTAQAWAMSMVTTGVFDHGDLAQRLLAAGYEYEIAGENIATGQDAPEEAVAVWMASAEHRANILDPSFQDVGSGEVAAPVFLGLAGATWVQDFGTLVSSPPPYFPVPRVRGLRVAMAERSIRYHFRVGQIRYIRGRGVRHGRVLRSLPPAGSRLPADRQIVLYVRR